MTPPHYSKLLANNIPNAHLEIVPDAGHMVMLEQPQLVAGVIEEFLSTI
jgi:pimeloyl-ACP methyl ester carboxylesterase